MIRRETLERTHRIFAIAATREMLRSVRRAVGADMVILDKNTRVARRLVGNHVIRKRLVPLYRFCQDHYYDYDSEIMRGIRLNGEDAMKGWFRLTSLLDAVQDSTQKKER